MQNLKNTTRLPELDALRGIAALSVIICHMLFMREGFGFVHIFSFWGVALFFMISGFVINLTIENKPSVRLFIINRFSRLYPAYWVSISLVTVLWWITSRGQVDWLSVCANITMFQEWFGVKSLDETYWTLRTELCFYFLVVFFLLFSDAKKIAFWGAIVLYCIVLYEVYQYVYPSDVLYRRIAFWFPLIRNFGYFYSGVLFYKFFKGKDIKWKSMVLLLSCLILNMFTILKFGNASIEHVSFNTYYILILSCYAIFACLIAGKLSFLDNPVLKFFGQISYSLYIIHFYLTFCFVIPVLEARGVNWIVVRLICIVLIFIVAFLVNRYVEVPFMKQIRKLLSPKLQPISK